MNNNPSIDQILEGVLMALDEEIAPAITNPRAHATLQMIQSLVQGVRQVLPEMDAQYVDEHNGMIATLRQTAETLGDVDGEAADRIRDRAATFGSWDDLPAPLDRAEVAGAHEQLGRAIEDTFFDLDELQRAGIASADDALQVVRGYLGPKFVRWAGTFPVGEGFVGRG
jgi:hypothetical protein